LSLLFTFSEASRLVQRQRTPFFFLFYLNFLPRLSVFLPLPGEGDFPPRIRSVAGADDIDLIRLEFTLPQRDHLILYNECFDERVSDRIPRETFFQLLAKIGNFFLAGAVRSIPPRPPPPNIFLVPQFFGSGLTLLGGTVSGVEL